MHAIYQVYYRLYLVYVHEVRGVHMCTMYTVHIILYITCVCVVISPWSLFILIIFSRLLSSLKCMKVMNCKKKIYQQRVVSVPLPSSSNTERYTYIVLCTHKHTIEITIVDVRKSFPVVRLGRVRAAWARSHRPTDAVQPQRRGSRQE